LSHRLLLPRTATAGPGNYRNDSVVKKLHGSVFACIAERVHFCLGKYPSDFFLVYHDEDLVIVRCLIALLPKGIMVKRPFQFYFVNYGFFGVKAVF